MCRDITSTTAIHHYRGLNSGPPWTRIDRRPRGVEDLRTAGFTVAALALALALGTEGDGLARRTLGQVDLTVTIPMAGGLPQGRWAVAA